MPAVTVFLSLLYAFRRRSCSGNYLVNRSSNLLYLLNPAGVAGKDIYADVACVGTGAGTATNPYCTLSQAFLDAGSSSGRSDSTSSKRSSALLLP